MVALAAAAAVVARVRSSDDDDEEHVSTPPPSVVRDSPIEHASPLVTVPTEPYVVEPTGGRRLIFVRRSELVTVDLDAGKVGTMTIPAQRITSAVQSGDHVFFVGDDLVHSYDGTQLTAVTPAIAIYRSATPGRVWALSQAGAEFHLREVDAIGNPTHDPYTVPIDWLPRAALDDRTFVLTRGAQVAVWDGATGRFRWQEGEAVYLAVAGNAVLWQRQCDAPVCVIHATDAAGGKERTYPPIEGLATNGRGRVAVDDEARRLAGVGYREEDGRIEQELVVIDLRSGQRTSARIQGEGIPMWSQGGEWVFVMTERAVEMAPSGAFHVGADGTIREVTMHVPSDARGAAVIVR